MTELDDEDVPPLEDLSDAVERARARAARQPERQLQKTREAPANARSGKELRSNGGSTETSRSVTSDGTQRKPSQKAVGGAGGDAKEGSQPPKAFGGFMKGFLLSTPAPSSASRAPADRGSTGSKVTVESKANGCEAHQASGETGSVGGSPSTSGEGNIPFLRAKPGAAGNKGPVIPEVQQAMKEAYPLLNTQEWMTESLLEKIEKHPILSRALRDPHLAQVLSQFQSNPQAALQAAAGNREMQEFLREFCSLMGDHFTELADKEERVGKSAMLNEADKRGKTVQSPAIDEVTKVLEKRAVREVLSDPQVQQLISFLKGDPIKAQRMLSAAGPEMKQKIQVLIDNGLLALQ